MIKIDETYVTSSDIEAMFSRFHERIVKADLTPVSPIQISDTGEISLDGMTKSGTWVDWNDNKISITPTNKVNAMFDNNHITLTSGSSPNQNTIRLNATTDGNEQIEISAPKISLEVPEDKNVTLNNKPVATLPIQASDIEGNIASGILSAEEPLKIENNKISLNNDIQNDSGILLRSGKTINMVPTENSIIELAQENINLWSINPGKKTVLLDLATPSNQDNPVSATLQSTNLENGKSSSITLKEDSVAISIKDNSQMSESPIFTLNDKKVVTGPIVYEDLNPDELGYGNVVYPFFPSQSYTINSNSSTILINELYKSQILHFSHLIIANQADKLVEFIPTALLFDYQDFKDSDSSLITKRIPVYSEKGLFFIDILLFIAGIRVDSTNNDPTKCRFRVQAKLIPQETGLTSYTINLEQRKIEWCYEGRKNDYLIPQSGQKYVI